MKTLLKHIAEPLNSIKKQPYHFVVWWLAAVVLGLAGFWLPVLLLVSCGNLEGAKLAFKNMTSAGNLASFSVVILADGIAASLVAVGAGSNITAAGIRGVVGIIALLLVIIQVGFLVACQIMGSISIGFQVITTVLAVLLATYIYCFRFASWEKGVDETKKEEDKEVKNLSKEAESKSKTNLGVKL